MSGENLVVWDVNLPNLPTGDAREIADAFRRLETRLAELENKAMRFYGDYEPDTCYPAGAVVTFQGRYTCYALRNTCDSPEIYPIGIAVWASGLPDPSTDFIYGSLSSPGLSIGQEFNMQTAGISAIVSRMRFYGPHDQATQSYRVLHARWSDALQQWETEELIGNFANTSKGQWIEFNTSMIWREDEIHKIYLNIESESAPTVWSANWNQVNRNGTPAAGDAQFYNNQTRIRFSYTDYDSTDRTTQLQAIPVGAEIQAAGQTWNVLGVTHNAGDADFEITPGGLRPAAGVHNYQFSYGAAADLWYAAVNNHWTTNPHVRGFYTLDSLANSTYTQEQYSLDVYWQQLTASPDWQIIAFTT